MNIFLTGGSGFVGSNLARKLALLGHNVTILLRKDSKISWLCDGDPLIHLHRTDGSYESIFDALSVSKQDCVIHIASLFIAQHKDIDVKQLIESNVSFPAQIMEAMTSLKIKNFINVGTSWQHYENQSYSPVNLYAATKQAFEGIISYYSEVKGIKSITLKLFDTYGPGDFRKKLFNLLRNSIKDDRELLMSGGEQLIDAVYIDDVVEAFLNVINNIDNIESQTSYGLTGMDRYSLKKLVNIYSLVVDREVKVRWGGLPYREREVMVPWSNSKKLPGWSPKVPINTGIDIMERDMTIGGLLCPELKDN